MHFHMAQIRTVDYCLGVMLAHPYVSDVVSNGCRLLSNLVLHDEVRDLCVKDGCLALIIAAMSAFPLDVDVNHYGCWALLNLSKNGTFLPYPPTTILYMRVLVSYAPPPGGDTPMSCSFGLKPRSSWNRLRRSHSWGKQTAKVRAEVNKSKTLIYAAVSTLKYEAEVQLAGMRLLERMALNQNDQVQLAERAIKVVLQNLSAQIVSFAYA